MPFRSEAQRRYLWMAHPDVAREFAAHTPKGAKLPMHAESKQHERSESPFKKAAEARVARKRSPGSRVGELKLFDELAGGGPYRDARHNVGMDSGTAAGILKLNRENRAADASQRRMRKGSLR